jgi:hypothetical protein
LSAADPPPDSIAAIVDPDKTESVSAGEAGEALDTLKAFFEENLARGKIPEALKSLESVRDAVAAAGSEG